MRRTRSTLTLALLLGACSHRPDLPERMMHLQTHTRWLPLAETADAATEDEWLRVVAEASLVKDLSLPADLQPLLQRRKFLVSQVAGRGADLFLPVELMQAAAPAPPPQPTAEHIAPTLVLLARDVHHAAQPRQVDLLVAGAELEHIDLRRITIAMGKAPVVVH